MVKIYRIMEQLFRLSTQKYIKSKTSNTRILHKWKKNYHTGSEPRHKLIYINSRTVVGNYTCTGEINPPGITYCYMYVHITKIILKSETKCDSKNIIYSMQAHHCYVEHYSSLLIGHISLVNQINITQRKM